MTWSRAEYVFATGARTVIADMEVEVIPGKTNGVVDHFGVWLERRRLEDVPGTDLDRAKQRAEVVVTEALKRKESKRACQQRPSKRVA